jgi:transposase
MAMKKSIASGSVWFKDNTFGVQDEIYVGIDVHKKQYHVALWYEGSLKYSFVMSSDNRQVIRKLSPIKAAVKKVVYEAGPTGYSLARLLESEGFPVGVAASSKTPRKSDNSAKTDSLDCRQLAQYAAKELLTYIRIPSEEQEAERQVVRLRDQFVSKRKCIRQQIKSFLLQHGIRWPGESDCWSGSTVAALKELSLRVELRYTLDMYLSELAFLDVRIKDIELKLKEIFMEVRHAERVKILRSHPGVGPVVSLQFLTEMFDCQSFRTAGEVGKYMGLCPRVHQSGDKRKDGPITKTGRRQLRSNLVEAAWVWIGHDEEANRVFRRILCNTGCRQVAIVGMARRLAIRLWRMLCRGERYRVMAA